MGTQTASDPDAGEYTLAALALLLSPRVTLIHNGARVRPVPLRVIQLLAFSALDCRPAVETLLGLRQRDVNLAVVSPARAPYSELIHSAGIELEEVDGGPQMHQRVAAAIRQRIREKHVDIVFLDGLSSPALVFVAIRGLGPKTVVRLCYLEAYRRPSVMTRLLYRHGSVARVMTDVDPRRVDDELTARWLAHKLRVVPSGHEVAWYPTARKLSVFGIPEGAVTVGAVCDSSDGSGLRWLVACARWMPMDVPVHFLLAAPQQSHEALRLSIRRIPFTQRFHLCELVEDAPGLLAACSVGVVTDWRSEVQRRACRQCLALGVPILAADSPPIDQVVQHGINGELLPGDDPEALAHSIFELYEDKDLRARLSDGALRLAEQVPSMEEVVKAHLAVFEDVVASSLPERPDGPADR